MYFLKTWLTLTLGFACMLNLQSQSDPVLFTVNGSPVKVSEFRYIYEKSNNNKADYSKKSLQESLDLYTKFKLKVAKARELKMDTISSLKNELAGYKKQLADSYLIDKEITEKLARQYYERAQSDIRASHIFVAAGADALPTDTLKAWQKVQDIKQQLAQGKKFEDLEPLYNEDIYSKPVHGDLGYMTAMLPNGFYELENQLYSMKKGETSGPVRSKLGWHFLKVTDIRPARGEMEISQILIKMPKGVDTAPYLKTADSIYQQLKKGMDFVAMAKALSQDKMTVMRGGYMGFVAINQYDRTFEDQVFSLKNDGDITKPFQTDLGFHIVKRISLKVPGPFEKDKKAYMTKIMQNERFNVAKLALIEKIKKENNYSVDPKVYRQYIDSVNTPKFFDMNWKQPNLSNKNIASMGKAVFTTNQLSQYLVENSRRRMRMNNTMSPQTGFEQLFNEFIAERVLDEEENRLDEKYPDYKALTREYEEGFLFFEVTNKEVWNKGSSDTIGLLNFYNQHKSNYNWDERANLVTYNINETSPEAFIKATEYIKTMTPQEVSSKLNTNGKQVITYTSEVIEKPKDGVMKEGMSWKAGSMSDPDRTPDLKTGTIKKIISILPPAPKELKDARGFVIADYQDYLEKQWVESLKKDYKIVINEDVLNSLVKK